MNRYMQLHRCLGTVVALAIALGGITACDVAESPEAGSPAQPERPATPEIRYQGAEVVVVELDREVVRPDAAGRARTWNRAFMVRLRISEPPAMAPVFHIYLDGERVPETGGWEEGIYFWVYDPENLRALDGTTVSYTFGRSERFEVGTLDVGDPETFRSLSEREIFDTGK